MSKSRILTIAAAIATTMAALFCSRDSAYGQRYCMEFKGGAVASNFVNSEPENKGFMDGRLGIQMGGGFGFLFPNEMLRVYAECYYTAKGENYEISDMKGRFQSDLNFFHVYPNARFYTPYVPVYVGAGLYIGGTAGHRIIRGDYLDQSHEWESKDYYKKIDIGPKVAIGAELGVGSVRLIIEGAYEYGFVNISNRSERKIKNHGLSLNAGLAFMLAGKKFRHY